MLVVDSPALRYRIEDIPVLTQHFANRVAQRDGLQYTTFSAEAMNLLQSYHWPGNIRELQNVIERCLCNATTAYIESIDVRTSIGPSRDDCQSKVLGNDVNVQLQSYESFQLEQERRYIDQLLKRHQGNISSAAREANVTRQGLHKIILRTGISTRDYRG